MIRSKLLGIGSYVPERVVKNAEIPYLDDHHVAQEAVRTETDDAWIQQRTGIKERHYVDEGTTTSDLALQASHRALADAGITADEIDCIIFGTLSPDIHFPGTAVFLQTKLGIDGEGGCACYDIRQQCSGFVYGLQMADSFVKAGLYKNVLLVGSELHSHSIDYTTRGRDVTILFGDGSGAVVVGPKETDDPTDGILYTHCGADGSGAWDLYLKVFEVKHMPYVYYDATSREENEIMYPQMNGKKVFLNAVKAMVQGTARALEKTGLGWKDIDWFVPHQANLRIIEAAVSRLGVSPERTIVNIAKYGNTSAASIPLALTEAVDDGRVQDGDLVLMSGFGAGMTWGSVVLRWGRP